MFFWIASYLRMRILWLEKLDEHKKDLHSTLEPFCRYVTDYMKGKIPPIIFIWIHFRRILYPIKQWFGHTMITGEFKVFTLYMSNIGAHGEPVCGISLVANSMKLCLYLHKQTRRLIRIPILNLSKLFWSIWLQIYDIQCWWYVVCVNEFFEAFTLITWFHQSHSLIFYLFIHAQKATLIDLECKDESR